MQPWERMRPNNNIYWPLSWRWAKRVERRDNQRIWPRYCSCRIPMWRGFRNRACAFHDVFFLFRSRRTLATLCIGTWKAQFCQACFFISMREGGRKKSRKTLDDDRGREDRVSKKKNLAPTPKRTRLEKQLSGFGRRWGQRSERGESGRREGNWWQCDERRSARKQNALE